MKAMILAAGLGTRLRPLTDHRPKAFVEVGGRTLLEIALDRLRKFGIRDVIVNVHHFAEMVVEHLNANDNFGMNVTISHEEVLLDTGGGLKKAAWFFEKENQPFILHNVDVISAIDFGRMVDFHIKHGALATLAVKQRKTSRYLLFDRESKLCGRQTGSGDPELMRPCEEPHPLAFCGIHVLSPRFLSRLDEEGVFSIITSYMRLAAQSEGVFAFLADEYFWRDVGRPEHIAQAEQDLKCGSWR